MLSSWLRGTTGPRVLPAGRMKLTYFNLKGRAELARLILAQAEVEYEDCRISREEWESVKPTTPLGKLPLLEVEGEVLAQSVAIARYLARQHGLAGNTEIAAAQADMVIDSLADLMGPVAAMMRESDEQKKADMKKSFSSETLPGWLTMLERLLTRRGGKHFAGGELTWADLAVFNVIENMNGRLADFNIQDYPSLEGLTGMVRDLPNINKWLRERPVTPF